LLTHVCGNALFANELPRFPFVRTCAWAHTRVCLVSSVWSDLDNWMGQSKTSVDSKGYKNENDQTRASAMDFDWATEVLGKCR